MGKDASRRGLGVLVWLAAAALLVARVREAVANPAAGMDYEPLRHAAQSLLDGRSIYSDRLFIYPPTAVPLLLAVPPLTAWIAFLGCAATLSSLSVLAWRSKWAFVVSGVVAALLAKSDLMTDSLWLANISLLLAPVAVGVLWLFHRERWGAGCALLVVSLLVKPLLVPLLLVPALRRRWRELVPALAVGLAVLATAVAVVPGGTHFFSALAYAAAGSNLRGAGSVYNVSIAGVFETHHWPAALAVRAVVALVALAVAWLRRGEPVIVGGVLLVGLFLAGGLSEGHYVFAALGATLLLAAISRAPATTALAAFAVLIAGVPRFYLGGIGGSPAAEQARWLVVEVVTFTAFAVAHRGSVTSGSLPDQPASTASRVAPTIAALPFVRAGRAQRVSD
jgi:arabinofuranan 3-O-arabinosyltransferase